MTNLTKLLCAGLCLLCVYSFAQTQTQTRPDPSEEARQIAKEAYIYGFPIVDNYRLLYAYFVDKENPEYKGTFNQLISVARVYTPEDRAIQTPNSDTPGSSIGLDLRTEPAVLTIPPIEKGRYFSVQMIDLYTHNFDYLGTRTTGNDGGNFLIAGPGWIGIIPKGIQGVLHSETQILLAIYRTQLFNAADLATLRKIQAGYKVQPLSKFMGKPAPPSAPAIDFLKPLSATDQRISLEFFNILGFALQFCPTHSSEISLRKRLAKIGIEPGKPFDATAFPMEMKEALKNGMQDGQKEIDDLRSTVTTYNNLFGTREFLKNNYLLRALAAQARIYGNSKEEAIYVSYEKDSDGAALNGARNNYTLRFDPGKFPPVNAFWSLTMYDSPQSLLVANPLNRYLIHSPMLPNLKKDQDGGITLYIQKDPPATGLESNWLPSPGGPFFMVLRLYYPKAEAFSGIWKQPPVQLVK
jgi:hypothetical protein